MGTKDSKVKESVEITIPKAPLKRNQRHPGASLALQYLKETFTMDSVATTAAYLKQFQDDEDFQCCAYTLEHLLNGEMVSDAYLMSLALVVQEIERLRLLDLE